MKRPPRPVALGLATFAIAGLSTVATGGPAHAATTLQVSATGTDTGDCQATPCATLQYAVNQAASLTDVVIIAIGAGTFDPSGGGVTVGQPFKPAALTIQGAGSGSGGTVLHTGDDGSGNGWAIQVLAHKPVTVTDLRITQSAPLVGPAAGANPELAGIISNAGNNSSLTVSRVVVDGLTGANGGASGTGCTPGTDVAGVHSFAGDLTVSDSTVSNLTGGVGGTASVGDGCEGGDAFGVGGSGRVIATDVAVNHMRGGVGGAGGTQPTPSSPTDHPTDTGGQGGDAGGIQGITSLTAARSTARDNRGGNGGAAGQRTSDGVTGSGGDGGGTFGFLGGKSAITDSETTDLVGAPGAPGAAGGADGGGLGGSGGVVVGYLLNQGKASVTNSTAAGLTGAMGGAGGTGTPAGVAGDDSAVVGIASVDDKAITLSNDTVSGIAGGANGSILAGLFISGAADVHHVTVTDAPIGVGVSGTTAIHLAASLLNTQTNCVGPVTDGGGNVASPDGNSCGFGATSDPAHAFGGELAALADNGGPTETIALSGTSSAAHQATGALCAGSDQRGFARPSGSCAAGAFEPNPRGGAGGGPVGGGSRAAGSSYLPGCGALTSRPDC